MVATRSPRFISRFRAAWVVHAPVGCAVTPGQMCPAGTVLDRDQRVNPPETRGVHVHEIHGEDGLGLCGEELAPGRTRPARCGIDASVMHDLPHGRGGDAMAEPAQLALHPPMSPRGVLVGHPCHQFLDRRSGLRDVRAGGGWWCSPTCARPACGPRPGSWRELPRRPRPSGGAAAAGIGRSATRGRRPCSGPGRPGGATWCSRAARPAVGILAQVSPHQHSGQTEQTAHQLVQD
jgi:hypothetical protein